MYIISDVNAHKKRIIYLAVGGLVAVLCIGLVYAFFVKKDESKPQEQEGNPYSEQIDISDIETESVEKIKKDFPDKELQYSQLMSSALSKKYVQKYTQAIEYFKAAAAVDGITEAQKDEANFSIYFIALDDLKDQKLADEYKEILGDKLNYEAGDQNVSEPN